MKQSYPKTEAKMRDIQRMIDLAVHCKHENTKVIRVPETERPDGTVIDDDVIEVCTAYYCGAIVRSGL